MQTSRRKSLIKQLTARDGYQCHYCGTALEESQPTEFNPKGASIDHIHPQNEGGSDLLENLVLACRQCNVLKSTKHYHEFSLATQTDTIIKFLMDES